MPWLLHISFLRTQCHMHAYVYMHMFIYKYVHLFTYVYVAVNLWNQLFPGIANPFGESWESLKFIDIPQNI